MSGSQTSGDSCLILNLASYRSLKGTTLLDLLEVEIAAAKAEGKPIGHHYVGFHTYTLEE